MSRWKAADSRETLSFTSTIVGFQQEGTLASQNLSPLTCPVAAACRTRRAVKRFRVQAPRHIVCVTVDTADERIDSWVEDETNVRWRLSPRVKTPFANIRRTCARLASFGRILRLRTRRGSSERSSVVMSRGLA